MDLSKMSPVEIVIQYLSFEIAKDAIRITSPKGEGKEYLMFLEIAAIMAYDGERLIRLLEKADILMPRELVQPFIDDLTEMLEATSGNMVTS